MESLNSTVRRAVRIRGHFPNDVAAAKLIYLARRNIEQKLTNAPIVGQSARLQLGITHEDRFATTG